MVLEILTYKEGSLDTNEIYVPLTDSVNLDIAVVEHSAPEGTVYVARHNLGEHASLLSLIKYASLFDYEAIIELNVLRSKLDNVNNNHNKRNDEPKSKKSPKLKRGKDTLSCYNMRSVNIHLSLLLDANAP